MNFGLLALTDRSKRQGCVGWVRHAVRFNLIHAPLSGVFLVFSERRDTAAAAAVLERTVTLKVTKLFAF